MRGAIGDFQRRVCRQHSRRLNSKSSRRFTSARLHPMKTLHVHVPGLQLSPAQSPAQSPSQSARPRPTDAIRFSPGSPRVSDWLKALGCRALDESSVVQGSASIDMQAESFEKHGFGGRGHCWSSGHTPSASPCCSQPGSAAGKSPGTRFGASPSAGLLPMTGGSPRVAGQKRSMHHSAAAPTAKGWESTRRAAPLGTAAGLTTLDLSCESFERQCLLGPSSTPSTPGSKQATPPGAKQATWRLQRTPPREATGWAIARRPPAC